jgi:hypothetical protein
MWAGGFERINAYTHFASLAVLAVTVLRRELPATGWRSERVRIRGLARRRSSLTRGRRAGRRAAARQVRRS